MIDKHGQYIAKFRPPDNITFIRGAECAAYLNKLRMFDIRDAQQNKRKHK